MASRPAREKARLTVVCTTYPVYLFASAVTGGIDGVVVERLDTGSTSCLHDYTLSMEDMKKLEGADVIAINGAGLEEFLEDALAASDARIIDCSEGIELLENLSHHHDEDEEAPPARPWRSPRSSAAPNPGPTHLSRTAPRCPGHDHGRRSGRAGRLSGRHCLECTDDHRQLPPCISDKTR